MSDKLSDKSLIFNQWRRGDRDSRLDYKESHFSRGRKLALYLVYCLAKLRCSGPESDHKSQGFMLITVEDYRLL